MPDAFGYFVSRGWTPEQSAGIVGNLFGESGLDPRAVGDGGRAYGIAQWHPDRQANFANVFGIPIQRSTLEQQLAFVDWELRNTEARAGRMLAGTSNVHDATYAVGRYYERPADLSRSLGSRISAAEKALGGLLDKGKSLFDWGGTDTLLNTAIPGLGTATNFLGITGDCNWLCQLKEWISDSGFFQRIALAIFAFILIIAAVFFLKSNAMQGVLKNVTT